MNNQLATVGSMNFHEVQQLGDVFYQSGFFTDLRSAAQCITKIMAGAEYGMGPFASLQNIHLIKGKPTLAANAMAAAVKANPKYDYRVIHLDSETCELEFLEGGVSIGVSEFTIADARKAQTQNLDKYARNMLFARAMSNGVKWFCPDVFATAVYVPEELGASVDGDGCIIDAVTEVESTPEPQPATDATLVAYADLRLDAMEMGFKTPNGNDPIEAEKIATEADAQKRIAALRDWKAQEASRQLEQEMTGAADRDSAPNEAVAKAEELFEAVPA